MKIAIFIPAYNAATTLPRVLDRIPQSIRDEVREVFVIDNNSPDNTHLIAAGYRSQHEDYKLSIFRNKENYGYGGSQKIAYQYAIEQGYDLVVMLHGDAQYAPEYLVTLLEPFRQRKVDMVFGSRMTGDPLGGGMPLIRFLGNKALTFVQNAILGTELSEFHSGYRLYSTHALSKVPFTNCSDNYHFDTEIIIQLVEAGMKIEEQPIPTHYGDEKSHVRIWHYGFDVLRVMLRYVLHRHGVRYEPQFDVARQPEIGSYQHMTERIE